MFKKILLPSDGSEAALRAARTVSGLVSPGQGIQITIATVILPLEIGNTDLDPEFVEAHNNQMRRRADEAIKQTSAVLEAGHIPHSCKVLEGTPVSVAIAEEAIAGGYDLIAMSSRGLGMQKDSLRYMGSVTEHVVRRVSIPVLVIPVDEASYRD